MASLKLVATPIPGAFVIESNRIDDNRGYFARTFCEREFRQHGLDSRVSQCSTSFNGKAGTLRGMHYQADPHAEAKVVRCTRGAVHDVALDLRPDSPSYLQWHAVELSEDNGRALFVPAGCAHGFQTLLDASEILYQISVPYEPSAARGVRWDDPTFGISWPAPPPSGRTISERDSTYPDFHR
jgi:dTDP-4-dehydrorhamnose 3,5-epimerase